MTTMLMTTMTVQPVRDDIHFGARIGGVTRDGLSDAGLRTEINDLFEEFGLLDLRGRRADARDAGGVEQRDRTAEGPPEPGRAPR